MNQSFDKLAQQRDTILELKKKYKKYYSPKRLTSDLTGKTKYTIGFLIGASVTSIITWCIGAFLIEWYNYIYLQVPGIHYWQYYAIAITTTICYKLFKPWMYFAGFVFVIALALQVLTWIGLITLPLKHYFH